MSNTQHDSILGCLLGTAVGDSVGLPTEAMSRAQIADRKLGENIQQRLVFGRGMISDDTEHTAMVARALAANPESIEHFEKQLAGLFRWWMAALPAGVGLATARAIFKLWLGFSPQKSGVKSAGNGPAMRSAIIGVYFCDDTSARQAFTRASATITHTDERAIEAALLVAEAAALASRQASTEEVLDKLQSLVISKEMSQHFDQLIKALNHAISLNEYTENIGYPRLVTGFAPCSVAVAIFSWLRYRGDFQAIISNIIICGGDTDTIAAIAGGIAGAECGKKGIPGAWLNRLVDWPISTAYLKTLADHLVDPSTSKAPRQYSLLQPFRNIVFLLIILAHGVLRLLAKIVQKQPSDQDTKNPNH